MRLSASKKYQQSQFNIIFFRLSIPVGDPRVQQPNSGAITVVEAAHVAKHLA